MAQYISKSALVAEIEKLMYRYDSEYDEDSTEVKAAKGNVCHEILCTIDALEVKEVALDDEIERKWEGSPIPSEHWLEFERLCKHFFELGLKA